MRYKELCVNTQPGLPRDWMSNKRQKWQGILNKEVAFALGSTLEQDRSMPVV
jgi:hypothetical protein